MALLDDVKSELAAIDNELPIAKKAQATAMIRFGNGLHSVDHHILVPVGVCLETGVSVAS